MTDTPADDLKPSNSVELEIDKLYSEYWHGKLGGQEFKASIVQILAAHERALLDSLLEQKHKYADGIAQIEQGANPIKYIEAVNIEVIQSKRKELS